MRLKQRPEQQQLQQNHRINSSELKSHIHFSRLKNKNCEICEVKLWRKKIKRKNRDVEKIPVLMMAMTMTITTPSEYETDEVLEAMATNADEWVVG